MAVAAAKYYRDPRLELLHTLAGFFFARVFGHLVCLRAESPIAHEAGRSGLKFNIRNAILRHGLFRWVHRFLYIGTQNRLFYEHFGVSKDKLIFAPYCVDNHRFQTEATNLSPQISTLRHQLGLPKEAFIVLFSGKFISKKRPLDLLKAVAALHNPNLAAVFVGEGELRKDMEAYIRDQNLSQQVVLTGFINQSDIPRYYSAADAFVMCSGIGETWGLSANEAMNFGLPVIISDQTGCATDLVTEGKNGYVFRCGDIVDLAEKITKLATRSLADRERMSAASFTKIDRYSYQAVIAGLQKI